MKIPKTCPACGAPTVVIERRTVVDDPRGPYDTYYCVKCGNLVPMEGNEDDDRR